jgi:hypothetical protein
MHQTILPISLIGVTIFEVHLSYTFWMQISTNITGIDISTIKIDCAMMWLIYLHNCLVFESVLTS